METWDGVKRVYSALRAVRCVGTGEDCRGRGSEVDGKCVRVT